MVASEGFAGICQGGWSDLGEFPVAGFSKAARVYGLIDEDAARSVPAQGCLRPDVRISSVAHSRTKAKTKVTVKKITPLTRGSAPPSAGMFQIVLNNRIWTTPHPM